MGSSRRKGWVRGAVVGGGLALGLGAVTWMVREAGVETTRTVIERATPWLPLALAIEALRIGAEVCATRKLFALLRKSLPVGRLTRVELLGYAIGNVVPAGRAVAEATKASFLAPFVSAANAAAVATTSQGLHLLASSCMLVVSSLAAGIIFRPALVATFAFQAVVLAGAGTLVLTMGRFAPNASGWLARLPRFGAGLAAFRHSLRDLPPVPLAPLGWIVASRALQVALVVVLAHAVGFDASPMVAMVAEGLLLTGATMGDFVPGQIGAVEGAFALFASELGTTRATALAIALLVHLVQTVWVLGGFFALAYDRESRSSRSAPRKARSLRGGEAGLIAPG